MRKVPQHRLITLFLLPVVIGGIGLAIKYTDGFIEFRDYAQGRTIPDVLVRSGKTGKEVRLLEYRSLAKFELEGFDRDLAPGDMPSSKNLEAVALQTRLPTLSIVINPDDLLNRDTGLLANYSKRGRSWERPAYVSYFENGYLRFATGAGLRVHGGGSRSDVQKSFRLHFRKLYGRPQILSRALFEGEGDPIRSIVVHNDIRIKRKGKANEEWHFMNPLAYELAREIGCITPSTQPVQLYLNGVYQGLSVLTEHISGNYLKAHFGHDDFVFARTKVTRPKGTSLVETGNRQKFDDFRNWPKTAPEPLQMSEVEKRVDLRNMTNWMISILYAGVTDPFQGPVLLDEKDPNALWFWINWDMDHAFMDFYDQEDFPWDIDNFTGSSAVLNRNRTRSIIFDRLRRESPEYRVFFLKRFTEVLNHILTQAKVSEKVARYEDMAISYGISDRAFLEVIKDFVMERPAVLRRQLDKYFNAGDSYKLHISSPIPIDIKVDGHWVGDEFVGWYFTDTPARIVIPESYRQLVDAWIINGEEIKMDKPYIELHLSSDTEIKVLLSRTSTM